MLPLLAAVALVQNTADVITHGLVIEGVARSGRAPFATDPVQKEIVEGTWHMPSEGDKLGNATWRKLEANKDSTISPQNAGGTYFDAVVDSRGDEIRLLRARGHSMVYVNGEPRMGDPYDTGYVVLAVALHRGSNEFLFALGRGGIKASLETPKSLHVFNLLDPTTPDVREGEKGRFFAAVIVVNATNQTARDLRVTSRFGDGSEVVTKLPEIPPVSVRKVRVDFEAQGNEKPGNIPLHLVLGKEDAADLTLRIRTHDQCYKRTFVSHIDGSVQYYAVHPARIQKPGNGLALSLHGASVEAIGQAEAYSTHDKIDIVCPTNRRPYGFDWEGIGRDDAMEVLADASRSLKSDPRQIYLCGHSMGGHGAWTVGAHFPDQFAVVFPSAGWQSFYTYGGKRRAAADDAIGQIFERASADSDTTLLLDNLKLPALYGLHGTADDNVPISELHHMKELLAAKGIEFAGYHEQEGAGHWWDVDPAPGADCVDWKPAFELMASRRRQLAIDFDPVDFTTVNPASSSTCEWVTVLQQDQIGRASHVQAKVEGGTIRAQTANILKLSFNLPSQVRDVQIDGSSIDVSGSLVKLIRRGGAWMTDKSATSLTPKEGARSGPFCSVFNNDFALVYSTHGTTEQNAWSFAKARFDAEQMLVRGNGSPDVLADTEVPKTARRNLVIYSCGESNSALQSSIAAKFPRKQSGSVGWLLYRPGITRFCVVGIVQGSDLAGCRLLDRLPYFVSGVGYPDWMAASTAVLDRGTRGVLGVGFFDANWEYDERDSVWATP